MSRMCVNNDQTLPNQHIHINNGYWPNAGLHAKPSEGCCSNISLTYIYILLVLFCCYFIILKDRPCYLFYHYQARKNRLLFISISTIFLLHLFHVITNPENGIVSRPLISLIILLPAISTSPLSSTMTMRFLNAFTMGLPLADPQSGGGPATKKRC